MTEGAAYWSACPLCPCPAHAPAPAPAGGRVLLRCAACRLVFYCSASHQRQHWPRHRRLCRAASRATSRAASDAAQRGEALFGGGVAGAEPLELEAEGDDGARRWAQVRLRAALRVELHLRRPLQPYERQLFFFPRVCEECKRSAAPAEECERCRCVAFCGPEHRRAAAPYHPPPLCRALAAARRLDLCLCAPAAPAQLAEESARAWPWSSQGLPGDALSPLWRPAAPDERQQRRADEEAASELLSGPLTLAAALLHLQSEAEAEAEAEAVEEAEVRLAGAAALEAAAPAVWELLLHALAHGRFRRFKRLTVALVGPDLPPGPKGPQEDAWAVEVDVCAACAAQGRSLVLHFHRTLYHTFIAENTRIMAERKNESKRKQKGDEAVRARCRSPGTPPARRRLLAVAALNCGFAERADTADDPWRPSLRALALPPPPPPPPPPPLLLLTAYTAEEAEGDLRALEAAAEAELKVELRAKENPWRSQRPRRDWERPRAAVFYANAFYSTLRPARRL